MTTVFASGVSIPSSTPSRPDLVRAWYFRRTSSKVNFTSAELNGCPSCHLTPGCRWNVYVLPSDETSQLSARSGFGVSFSSRKISPLYRLSATKCVPPAVVMAGLNWPGSAEAAMTSVPPRTGWTAVAGPVALDGGAVVEAVTACVVWAAVGAAAGLVATSGVTAGAAGVPGEHAASASARSPRAANGLRLNMSCVRASPERGGERAPRQYGRRASNLGAKCPGSLLAAPQPPPWVPPC